MTREQVAAQALPAHAFGAGDAVQVYTRMGRMMTEGTISLAMGAGVCLGSTFYAGNVCLFVPVITEAADATVLEVDKQVSKKIDPDGTGAAVDKLPDEIRQAIVTDDDLTEDQVQRILAAVGDALMKVFKSFEMREDTLYARVAVVQAAVQRALKDIAAEATKPPKKGDDDGR